MDKNYGVHVWYLRLYLWTQHIGPDWVRTHNNYYNSLSSPFQILQEVRWDQKVQADGGAR